jgi:hypothetical protein
MSRVKKLIPVYGSGFGQKFLIPADLALISKHCPRRAENLLVSRKGSNEVFFVLRQMNCCKLCVLVFVIYSIQKCAADDKIAEAEAVPESSAEAGEEAYSDDAGDDMDTYVSGGRRRIYCIFSAAAPGEWGQCGYCARPSFIFDPINVWGI